MKQEVPAVLRGEVGRFLHETRSACGPAGRRCSAILCMFRLCRGMHLTFLGAGPMGEYAFASIDNCRS